MELDAQTRRLVPPSLAIGVQLLTEGLLDLVPRGRMFFSLVIARLPRLLEPVEILTWLFLVPLRSC